MRSIRDALRPIRRGILATIAAIVVLMTLYATSPSSGDPGSDGHYTWLYARSLAYDHDIDFTNDYAVCGDPQTKNVLRGTSHPDNPFYAGPAILWVPAIWVVRSTLSFSPADPPTHVAGCN